MQCFHRKAISIAYYEWVFVALGAQHANRMTRITLSYMACLLLPHFSTLSHKQHDFRKEIINSVIEHKIRVLIITVTFV
jgi:hypothetical protein